MTSHRLFYCIRSEIWGNGALILLLVLPGMAFENSTSCFSETGTGAIIMDVPGLPLVADLNIGESIPITRKTPAGTMKRELKLISIQHEWQPDYHIEQNPDHRTLLKAVVTVEVSGEKAELIHRPYQMPVSVNGLRLYVETTKTWATQVQIAEMDLRKDARLSLCAEGESWGPEGMVFPIKDFRWRSSSYNNTWSALVPYNLLYYHRGEDFGAIPDRLEVMAALDGRIVTTPLPGGDEDSNIIRIQTARGFTLRYAHMNIGTIAKNLTAGAEVKRGQVIGKTGAAWNGKPSQHNDPHLHFDFHFHESPISAYPAMIEAYFNTFPDEVLAVAGGYHFALPGEPVELDASRSIARPGGKIRSVLWILHDQHQVDSAQAMVHIDQPGLYSEELIVKTEDGAEDRDFAQIRVFDPERGRKMAAGWCHYTPVRGIHSGTPVLFWNRLWNTTAPVMVNFGDGSAVQPIQDELVHTYGQPGIYTVTFSSQGPEQEPVTVKLKVAVEDR